MCTENASKGTAVNIFWKGKSEKISIVIKNVTGYVHEVLVNRLGGLSQPRKSVVRLTDRPDMTLDVYHGGKTTIQPTSIKQSVLVIIFFHHFHT